MELSFFASKRQKDRVSHKLYATNVPKNLIAFVFLDRIRNDFFIEFYNKNPSTITDGFTILK